MRADEEPPLPALSMVCGWAVLRLSKQGEARTIGICERLIWHIDQDALAARLHRGRHGWSLAFKAGMGHDGDRSNATGRTLTM